MDPRKKKYNANEGFLSVTLQTVAIAVPAAEKSSSGGTDNLINTIELQQPQPLHNLREISSEEFLSIVRLRRQMAEKNIIALEEMEKASGRDKSTAPKKDGNNCTEKQGGVKSEKSGLKAEKKRG